MPPLYERLQPATDGDAAWAPAFAGATTPDRLRIGPTCVNEPAERAPGLATVMISALEGAIMLARVCRDVGRLDTVVSELAPVLDSYAG